MFSFSRISGLTIPDHEGTSLWSNVQDLKNISLKRQKGIEIDTAVLSIWSLRQYYYRHIIISLNNIKIIIQYNVNNINKFII